MDLILLTDTQKQIASLTGNDAHKRRCDLGTELCVKFELVVDKLINQHSVPRIGQCKVKVLILGFPGFGNASKTWSVVCLRLESDCIRFVWINFSLLLFLHFFILIKEKLHFVDLIERILKFLFNVVLVSRLFGNVLFWSQRTDQFVVLNQDQLGICQNDQQL